MLLDGKKEAGALRVRLRKWKRETKPSAHHAGLLLSKVHPGIRYCIACASLRAPRPCFRYSWCAFSTSSMSSSTPRPPRVGTFTKPPSICSGALVRRWPSCQIQCVSMAVTLPGAAAATCVNMASDTSKWLFECEPQVRPQAWHSCATRTEPCIVQKCGSASGMSTDCSERLCTISRQSVATMLVAVGRPVARRNSAITSRPENTPSAPQGSSA